MNNPMVWMVLAAATAVPGSASSQESEAPESYLATPDGEIAPIVSEAPVTGFVEALARAYANQPDLLAERASARSTDYRYASARGQFGPTLDLQASHAFQRDRSELIPGRFSGTQGFSSTASAVLNQPLLTFGRLRGAENRALAEIAFARQSLRLVEAQTLLNVVNAYVGVQRDGALVAIAAQNLELLERQLSDNRERFRVREITSSDLQQIETRVEFGRAQVLQAQGQLGASRSLFVRFVGVPAGALSGDVPLELPVQTVDEALALADRDGPVVIAAKARERISRATIELAQANFRPRVDLQGTAVYGPLSPYANADRFTQLRGEISVQWPLLDVGTRRAILDEARAANDADWRLVDSAMRETSDQVSSNWDRLTTTRQSIVHYAAAVASAQRAYDGALVQERAGARTTLDVLDLARDLLNVRASYVRAIADDYLARASLLAAMGRMEAQFVAPGTPLYRAEDHFDRVRDNADVPLLTDFLSSLDGLLVDDDAEPRFTRDPDAGNADPVTSTLPTDPVPTIGVAMDSPVQS